MTEEMVAYVAQEALGTTAVDWKGETIDLTPPWRRLPSAPRSPSTLGFDPFAGPRDEPRLRAALDAKGLETAPTRPGRSWSTTRCRTSSSRT